MIDLELLEGDLRIKKVINVNGQDSYDLDLVEDNISAVLIKALKTPLGYLKFSVIENLSLQVKDEDYGNSIYDLLAAPLNFNWYSEIRTKILNTVSALNITNLIIKDMNIRLAAKDLVIVDLTYSYKNVENSVVIEI